MESLWDDRMDLAVSKSGVIRTYDSNADLIEVMRGTKAKRCSRDCRISFRLALGLVGFLCVLCVGLVVFGISWSAGMCFCVMSFVLGV
jgi:hypothetical protein